MAAEYTFGPVLALAKGARVPAAGATFTLTTLDGVTSSATYDLAGNPMPLKADAFGQIVAGDGTGFKADIPQGLLTPSTTGLPSLVVRALEVPITAEEAQAVADATATTTAASLSSTFATQTQLSEVATGDPIAVTDASMAAVIQNDASQTRTALEAAAAETVVSVTITAEGQALTLPTVQVGTVVTVILTQDQTAGRTVTWPTNIVWDSGTAPMLTGEPGGRDAFAFLWTGTDWLGFASGTFRPAMETTPPSIPTGLTATDTGLLSVDLAWSAATDNVAVDGYEYRIGTGEAIDAGDVLTHRVYGLTGGQAYSFQVRAYDASGNRSGWSTAANVTVSAPSDWEAAVTALTPSLWWRLGDPTGTTFADTSGNGRVGTLSGTATGRNVASLIPSDPDEGALRLGGAGKVYIPSGSTTWMNNLTYTVIVTVKAAAAAAEQHIVTRSGGVFHLALASTGVAKMGVYGSSSVGDLVGTKNVRDNVAHLIVATVSAAGTHFLYVDGTQEATLTGHVPVSPTTEFSVGNRGAAGTLWYTGDIDEVVYLVGTALTAQQVTNLHNAWAGV